MAEVLVSDQSDLHTPMPNTTLGGAASEAYDMSDNAMTPDATHTQEDIVDANVSHEAQGGTDDSIIPDISSLQISQQESGHTSSRGLTVTQLPPEKVCVNVNQTPLQRDFISIHAVPTGQWHFPNRLRPILQAMLPH